MTKNDEPVSSSQKIIEAEYQAWMMNVDLAINDQNEFGLTSMDIPDWSYWGDFRDGLSPIVCAKRALKNARNS